METSLLQGNRRSLSGASPTGLLEQQIAMTTPSSIQGLLSSIKDKFTSREEPSLLPSEVVPEFKPAVLEGGPEDRPAYVMEQVERYAPSSKYKNAQQIFKGTISRETGGTFDPVQRQMGGGPGKGLFQMERDSWRYTDRNTGRIRTSSRKTDRHKTFNKGMYSYYTDWLDKTNLGDNSENQIRFVMSSLDRKTGYKFGNESKIKKALKDDNPERAMANFTKYAIKPAWVYKKIKKRGKVIRRPKSIAEIMKSPEFKKTMELSL